MHANGPRAEACCRWPSSGPATEHFIQLLRILALASAEPVRGKRHDGLARPVCGDGLQVAPRHADVAPAVEDRQDRMPPGTCPCQQRQGVNFRAAMLDNHGDRQLVQWSISRCQEVGEVFASRSFAFDEDCRDSSPGELHPAACLVIQQPIKGEDG
jgi:hypothetical protein